MSTWQEMTAADLGRGIDTGEIDPVELTQFFLDAIDAHEYKDRIYARVTPDRALSEASAAQDRARLKLRRSPLDGVPISWKDLFDTAGVPTESGSQLLKGRGARLPNAQVVGECAAALGISADWLLGLTDRPETAADILATSLSLTEAPRALVDAQIFQWHKEAAGHKIRHVPAGLPDMLKTQALLEKHQMVTNQ